MGSKKTTRSSSPRNPCTIYGSQQQLEVTFWDALRAQSRNPQKPTEYKFGAAWRRLQYLPSFGGVSEEAGTADSSQAEWRRYLSQREVPAGISQRSPHLLLLQTGSLRKYRICRGVQTCSAPSSPPLPPARCRGDVGRESRKPTSHAAALLGQAWTLIAGAQRGVPVMQ